MKTTTTKKPAVKRANGGPRRRAILSLFRDGYTPGEISRLFKVKVADVWVEIRKAL